MTLNAKSSFRRGSGSRGAGTLWQPAKQAPAVELSLILDKRLESHKFLIIGNLRVSKNGNLARPGKTLGETPDKLLDALSRIGLEQQLLSRSITARDAYLSTYVRYKPPLPSPRASTRLHAILQLSLPSSFVPSTAPSLVRVIFTACPFFSYSLG